MLIKFPNPHYLKIENYLKDSFLISVITQIEFLGWNKFPENEYDQAKEFLNNAQIIFLDHSVATKTIELKRTYAIKLGDAEIAASCLLNNLTLITRDEDDFKKIRELKTYNPFS